MDVDFHMTLSVYSSELKELFKISPIYKPVMAMKEKCCLSMNGSRLNACSATL